MREEEYRRRRRWVPVGAIMQGNGAAYWPASQSNMAAGVSVCTISDAALEGKPRTPAAPGSALMSPWQVGMEENSLPLDFPPPRLLLPDTSDKSQDFPRLSQTTSRCGEWLGAGADYYCFGGAAPEQFL